MEKIKIITDSTSDITLDVAQKYGITVLGQAIRFGEESYTETIELSKEDFWKKLREFDGIPKTAQINVTKFVDEFKKNIDSQIIFIGISGNASGTIQSANLAKNMILEENPDADISIIDSQTFTYGYGLWVIEAAKMASDGKTKEEIIAFVEDRLSKTGILFAVGDLNYLEKGGRISPAAKMIGNVLDIKPILSIVDGLVMNVNKVRGSKKLYSKIVDMMTENGDDLENQTVYILHSDDFSMVDKMKDAINAKVKVKNIQTLLIGGTVGTNTGPDIIAVIYLKK